MINWIKNVIENFNFYFEQFVVPTIENLIKVHPAEHNKFFFLMLFIFLLFVLIAVFFEYWYEEKLTDIERGTLLNNYAKFKAPFILFCTILEKNFASAVKTFDDPIVVGIIFCINASILIFSFPMNLFETPLLQLDPRVHSIFICFSIFVVLCYNPKK